MSISNDALTVVLAFLDRASLNAALAVCTRWSAAILSMRSVGLSLRDVSDQIPSFLPLLGSPLARRHVGALSLGHHTMCAKEIAMLTAPLTQLRELSFAVSSLESQQSLDWSFPPNLRALTLEGGPYSDDAPMVRSAIIRAIAQLPYLETLSLSFSCLDGSIESQPVYDLTPLATLRCLTTLTIDFPVVFALADALRQFSSLKHLSLFKGSAAQLAEFVERLTTPPHTLSLQELAIATVWSDRIAAVLTRIPTLAILSISGPFDAFSSLHFLRSFPQLTSLSISSLDPEHFTPQHVVECLVALPRLTRLYLVQPMLRCADLARLLRALPLLAELEFDNPAQLESLRCFAEAAPTLARSLTKLALYQLEHPALTTAELLHLRGLNRLTDLNLEFAREGLIDEATRQALTPPSAWFPKLARFQC